VIEAAGVEFIDENGGVPAFDCGAPSRSKATGRWHARVTDRESAAGVENGRPALTEPAYTNPHIE
jgi:hypothetical protein